MQRQPPPNCSGLFAPAKRTPLATVPAPHVQATGGGRAPLEPGAARALGAPRPALVPLTRPLLARPSSAASAPAVAAAGADSNDEDANVEWESFPLFAPSLKPLKMVRFPTPLYKVVDKPDDRFEKPLFGAKRYDEAKKRDPVSKKPDSAEKKRVPYVPNFANAYMCTPPLHSTSAQYRLNNRLVRIAEAEARKAQERLVEEMMQRIAGKKSWYEQQEDPLDRMWYLTDVTPHPTTHVKECKPMDLFGKLVCKFNDDRAENTHHTLLLQRKGNQFFLVPYDTFHFSQATRATQFEPLKEIEQKLKERQSKFADRFSKLGYKSPTRDDAAANDDDPSQSRGDDIFSNYSSTANLSGRQRAEAELGKTDDLNTSLKRLQRINNAARRKAEACGEFQSKFDDDDCGDGSEDEQAAPMWMDSLGGIQQEREAEEEELRYSFFKQRIFQLSDEAKGLSAERLAHELQEDLPGLDDEQQEEPSSEAVEREPDESLDGDEPATRKRKPSASPSDGSPRDSPSAKKAKADPDVDVLSISHKDKLLLYIMLTGPSESFTSIASIAKPLLKRFPNVFSIQRKDEINTCIRECVSERAGVFRAKEKFRTELVRQAAVAAAAMHPLPEKKKKES